MRASTSASTVSSGAADAWHGVDAARASAAAYHTEPIPPMGSSAEAAAAAAAAASIYTCAICFVDVSGKAAWLNHINSSEHNERWDSSACGCQRWSLTEAHQRQRILGQALRTSMRLVTYDKLVTRARSMTNLDEHWMLKEIAPAPAHPPPQGRGRGEGGTLTSDVFPMFETGHAVDDRVYCMLTSFFFLWGSITVPLPRQGRHALRN